MSLHSTAGECKISVRHSQEATDDETKTDSTSPPPSATTTTTTTTNTAEHVRQIPASKLSMRVSNPIRKIVEGITFPKGVEIIPLTLGDPTVFHNYFAPSPMIEALIEHIRSFKHNGYVHSAGTSVARKAIAKTFSAKGRPPLTESDVVITSGCSGALEIIISAMHNPGDNILLPQPGFPLYQTLAEAREVEVRYYTLDPNRNWEINLESLESLVDERTRAILVNNPSNPCGSVYSEKHLRDILSVAERHGLPIIADEIYGHMTFGDNAFHPLAELSDHVPIVSAGGLAKEYVVPGWRVGWIMVHDRDERLQSVRQGFFALSQLTLGASSLMQSIIPIVLDPVDETHALQINKFRAEYYGELEKNCSFTVEALSAVPGIDIVAPQGAMYGMIQIKPEFFSDIENDVDFANKLLNEQGVFLLPGQCFGIKNFARIVFAAPKKKLRVAYERIAKFCSSHLTEEARRHEETQMRLPSPDR